MENQEHVYLRRKQKIMKHENATAATAGIAATAFTASECINPVPAPDPLQEASSPSRPVAGMS